MAGALNEYHIYGEEWAQKLSYRTDLITRDTTLELALFDADDAASGITVTDTTDVTSVSSTEPSGGNYVRQTVTLDSSDVTITKNGDSNYQADIATQVFNIDGSTGTINAYAVIGTFQSDEAGDGSPSKHVLYTGDLSPERNLSGIVELTVDSAAIDLE